MTSKAQLLAFMHGYRQWQKHLGLHATTLLTLWALSLVTGLPYVNDLLEGQAHLEVLGSHVEHACHQNRQVLPKEELDMAAK
jgi:hypothetical protein